MLALTGCTDGDDEPGSVDTTNSGTPDPTQASETAGSPTASPTGVRPSGGTSDHPQVVEATTNVFDWQSLDATTGDTVTRVGDTTITVDQEQSQATIEGPNDGSSIVAPGRVQVQRRDLRRQLAWSWSPRTNRNRSRVRRP